MTWQEELSRLDAVLASGKISADEYRRRRDEILAGSAGGAAAAPAQQAPAPNSFPPPFRWDQGQDDSSNRTQVVSNVPGKTPQPENADRTQVVSAGDASAERTQFVRPAQPPHGGWQATPPQNPYSASSAQPPPWTTGDHDLMAPQWGGGGFQAHGPEVFDDKPSGKGKVFAIFGVVLVLVAGAVLWFTVFKGTGSNNADPSPTNPAPTSQSPTKKKPTPFGNLTIPEGAKNGPNTYTPQQLEAAKPLPEPDLLMLKRFDVTETRSVVVLDTKGNSDSMWAFKCADPAALRDAMENDQLRFAFAESPTESKPGVKVFGAEVKDAAGKTLQVRRGSYVSGGELLRVEVLGANEADVVAAFKQVLADQLEHTPAK
ncbi:SHOCT domain-containing protein [Lentzea sp. NPDC006480]|uniref:SHOCT domain-containing protein n=1 Tax=Lentzea sp. NPDC006480 TaxID=3157176 RepID=UPI0033B31308